ncbi:vanadium-dependent haloperoxidase [Thiothrix eikelboomii]|uniref:vanadium-dependent haloperoxidase n=1 Tax=Thiothrix eikelboomii TaxID=92487 RepID=UPI003BAEAC4A
MFSERNETRRLKAQALRQQASTIATERSHPQRINNGEEAAYGYLVNYHKGLPHNAVGEVQHSAYRAFLNALTTSDPYDFDHIPQGHDGKGRKFVSPQAGLAFDLQGPDAQSLMIPPAPRVDSAENSAEMGELYWMSLLRDLNFADYDNNSLVNAAVASMNTDFSDFRGAKEQDQVTKKTLFRGISLNSDGVNSDAIGPYISQFLLKGNTIGTDFSEKDGYIRFGTLRVDQRNKVAIANTDYLTDFDEWLAIQNGKFPNKKDVFEKNLVFLRNLRDLATYVHFDQLYEAYFNACLYLLSETNAEGKAVFPFSQGNPYYNSPNQDGFATFGGPHLLSLVTEVATRALKAVWHTKWFVHRRIRPEGLGGLIHVHLSQNFPQHSYPMINEEILQALTCGGLSHHFNQETGFLLPMAFPEGSPLHPAYGAGHATVAGACVTILKAWFTENTPITNPVQASTDGLSLIPYNGEDADQMTLLSELNKLASNIAIGRNGAGVHWRSDYTESIKLGETVALGILQEQSLTYNETLTDGQTPFFQLTCFDGRTCHIAAGQITYSRITREAARINTLDNTPDVVPDIIPNLG